MGAQMLARALYHVHSKRCFAVLSLQDVWLAMQLFLL